MIFHHILSDLISDFLKGSKSLIGCNKTICRPLKTFVCVSLRYRKHCGGSVEIVVVVCGKICGNMCGKMCVKWKNCRIGTTICVVVDIDYPIMIVVCGSSFVVIFLVKYVVKMCGKIVGKIDKIVGLEQKLAW